MARTIILGYDGSDCADAALEAAVDVAHDRPETRIVVVLAHPVPRIYGLKTFTGVSRPDPADTEGFKRRTTAELQPLLEEACARIEGAGVAVEGTLEWESPDVALLNAARRHQADLIVVGAHGADAIGRAVGRVLLGSTAGKLLHFSHVPVLVVPHAD